MVSYERPIACAEAIIHMLAPFMEEGRSGVVAFDSHIKPILCEYYTIKSCNELSVAVAMFIEIRALLAASSLNTESFLNRLLTLRLAAAIAGGEDSGALTPNDMVFSPGEPPIPRTPRAET